MPTTGIQNGLAAGAITALLTTNEDFVLAVIIIAAVVTSLMGKDQPLYKSAGTVTGAFVVGLVTNAVLNAVASNTDMDGGLADRLSNAGGLAASWAYLQYGS